MKVISTSLITVCLFQLMIVSSAYAVMYKCKEADGSFTFSDTGCNESELIQKKILPKPTQAQNNGNTNNQPTTTTGGCSQADKSQANEHFTKAEEILEQRRRFGDLTSGYRKLTSKYKHEMKVGQLILSACSGVAMPQEQKSGRLRTICHTIGTSTFCN